MTGTIVAVLSGLVVGFGLGIVYFASLAWTVRSMPDHRQPALLIAGSYLARVGLLAVGLVALAMASPLALVVALPALIAARFAVIRRHSPGGSLRTRGVVVEANGSRRG